MRSAAFYGEHFGLTERLHEDDHLLILGSDGGRFVRVQVADPGGCRVEVYARC